MLIYCFAVIFYETKYYKFSILRKYEILKKVWMTESAYKKRLNKWQFIYTGFKGDGPYIISKKILLFLEMLK